MKTSSKKTKIRVFTYFHTHWDREWYKTRIEFNFRLVKVVDDIIKKLESNELPCFYFDGQVSALKDYLKFRPENENKIRNLIKEEKLFIGPFYCSTDSFLVSLQSFLANIELGLEYSKDFGCQKFIGYCADTFGHSKSLPQIFNYYNFNAGMFWRGLGELPQCFNWNELKSIYLKQGYFHDYLNTEISYEKKAELIETQLNKINDGTQKILLMPLGADHLKLADDIKTQIKEINKHLKKYTLELSNPFEYISMVTPTTKFKTELRNNSKNFILPGVYSSRIDLKQKNSYSQWQLFRLAEPLNALCFANKLTNQNFQPHINLAKEELIKNHAHDSIYGCSIDEVHKDMLRRFDIANQTSKCTIQEILNELSSETSNINIINLSDYNYSDLCEIKTEKKLRFGQLIKKEYYVENSLSIDPNKIPVTEDFKNIYTYLINPKTIKPFSISNFEEKEILNDIKITNSILENSKIKLEIKNKKIEITDKTNNKTYKDFINFIDFADVGDSYNFAPIKNDKKIKANVIDSKIKTKGNLRSILEINLKIEIPKKSNNNRRSKQNLIHKLKLYAILDTNCEYIKFHLIWQNKSENHIFKTSFNLEKPITKTISDDMLGETERTFDPNYDIAKLIPAPKGIELTTNTAPMQTFVETQGVAIITKGLNEYEIRKNSLEITLLRATDTISNPKNPARGTPAGPPIKTPDLQCLKENQAEFALCFSKDTEKIKAIQQSYYGCTFAFFANQKPQQLLNIKEEFINANFNNSLNVKAYDKKKGRIIDLIKFPNFP